MQKTLYIPLDTTLDDAVECEKLVKRGDTLKLQIKVFVNGVLADLTGQSIDLILKKADNTLIEYTINTSDIANGVVTATLSQQSTLAAGTVSGELQIYTDGTLTSSNTFTFVVDASLADDVIEVSQNDIQILSELKVLIADGQVKINTYEENILAIGNTIEAVEALANVKLYIDTNLPALQSANAQATVNIANETARNDTASQNISDLDARNNTASSNISALDTKNSIASTNISDLDSKNTTATQNISDLDARNNTASSNISSLDAKNATASTNISTLDAENVRAEVNIAALESFGDATALTKNVTMLKAKELEDTGYGVISGLTVTAQSTPDMSVNAIAGVVHFPNGDRFAPIANNALSISTADATNARIDIIYVDSTGVTSYLAGTPSASPIAPATPTGGFLLYEINVVANATSITGSDIVDKRKIKNTTDLLATELSEKANQSDLNTTNNNIATNTSSINSINTSLSNNVSNLNSLFKDILKMKMRQTGLNLDNNAWSDTIEDISGINTSLSSGYWFDVTNKSLKLGNMVTYDGSTLPTVSTPPWTILTSASSGTITQTISNDRLISSASSGSETRILYYREMDNVINSKTKRIEFKGKVTNTNGMQLSIIDGSKNANVAYLLNGYVQYYNGTSWVNINSSVLPLSSEFTSIVECDSVNGMKVYVNDTLIGTIPYANLSTSTANLISLTLGNPNYTSHPAYGSEVEYLKYTLDTSTLASSAVIIWNEVTSTQALTKALVEAVQNLGTGTITYYISRDNGVTFTQCSLDTVTDISSQPSGTNIVLKAVITGNAELLAVAWGGEV